MSQGFNTSLSVQSTENLNVTEESTKPWTLNTTASAETYKETVNLTGETVNLTAAPHFSFTDFIGLTAPAHKQNTTLSIDDGRELQVSAFPEYSASTLIWKCVPPVLLFTGTFGNVATVVVYRLRLKRISCSQPLFLTLLAVADLFVLYWGLIPDIAYHVFDYDIRGLNDAVCKLSLWILDSSGGVSVWLLVAMTTQRAMSVTWPHRVTSLCSHRKSRDTIIAIVVFQAVFESHHLYGFQVHDSDVHADGACGAAAGEYAVFWNNVWPWMEMCVNSTIPSIILVVSNVILIRSLRSSTKDISHLGSCTATSSRKRTISSTTQTILVVSITFLLLAFPIDVVIIAWSLLEERIPADPHLEAKMELAWALSNMSWYANSAVNFVLYCLSASTFREEFVKCFSCKTRHAKSWKLSHTEVT